MIVQLADTEATKTLGICPPVPERAPDEQLSPARGIATAVMISTPFWALVAFAVYIFR